MGILFILLWITCGFIAAGIASGRNHNAGVWFVIGALFGVFGLIGAFLLPDKSKSAEKSATAPNTSDIENQTRTCPFCAEEIKAKAVVCRFCGKDVPPVETPKQEAPITLKESELSKLKSEVGEDAVQLSSKDAQAWHCVCGSTNSLEIKNCGECKRNRDFVLANYKLRSL